MKIKKRYKISCWIIFLILLLALTYSMMYRKYEVHGDSMYPALKDGQMLRMRTYEDGKKLKRGQIIAIKVNIKEKDCLLIKRIIALQGDHLKEEAGKFYLNSKCIENSKDMQDEAFELVVPKGKIFVMGDNRKHSLDSRALGLLRISDIIAVKE